jgi:hypothetical protein
VLVAVGVLLAGWLLQALCIMFVFVLMTEVMEAAEHLDRAGSKLLNPSSSSGSSRCSRHAAATGTNNKQQQQQPMQPESGALSPQDTSVREMLRAALLIPLLSNLAGACWAVAAAAAESLTKAATTCLRPNPSTLNQAGLKQQQQQQQPQGSAWHWRGLLGNRDAAAAFKFWLAMSVLLVLAMLIVGDPGNHLWPEVSALVKAVPTHGMVAMVLVWHERVESTLIRVSSISVCLLGTTLCTMCVQMCAGGFRSGWLSGRVLCQKRS